jgi:hypothetical protein
MKRRWWWSGGALAALLIIAALVYLVAVPQETAESYCHDIYDHGGTTPGWAVRARDFSDYRSCVTWYEDVRSQSAP